MNHVGGVVSEITTPVRHWSVTQFVDFFTGQLIRVTWDPSNQIQALDIDLTTSLKTHALLSTVAIPLSWGWEDVLRNDTWFEY